MRSIDLNCDMGESYGTITIGNDAEILDLVSSANIACGFHGGDPSVMKKTVAMALDKKVAIGAHPGFPDREGFGRKNMDLSPDTVFDIVLYQVGALDAFVKAAGSKLKHVKPHGALYNMALKSKELAEAIAAAVVAFDPSLIFFGLPGSELISQAKAKGLKTASEVFADRTYQSDGSLTPRTEKNALIQDPIMAVQQVLKMVKEQKVNTVQGKEISIQADTVCIHGDTPSAAVLAREIRRALEAAGISVKPIGNG